LGRSAGPGAADAEEPLGGGCRAADGGVPGAALVRAAPGRRGAGRQPQRILRARLCDAGGGDPAASAAHPAAILSAALAEAAGAAFARGGGADPASVSARRLDAAGGAGGSLTDRRAGERANSLQADAPPRRPGAGLSRGALRRRLGLPISGRGVDQGAEELWPPAGLAAGGLWHPAQRAAATVGVRAGAG